jgi:exopolysaccharide production protein ExoQ
MKKEEHSVNSNALKATLIVILIMRICSYFMLSESVEITQALKIIIRFTVTAITGIMLVASGKRTVRTLHSPGVLLYIAYLIAGCFSLMWSSSFNDSFLHLLMDVETFVFCLLFSQLIIQRETESEKLRLSSIISISIFCIAASFLIGKYLDPDKFFRLTHGGEEARLGGFIINPNELGMLLAIGIAATLMEIRKTKWSVSALVAITLMGYDLVITGSRSSIIGLLLIVFYFITQSKTAKIKVAAVTATLISIPFIISQVIVKQGDVDEVMSMTGRIPFWKDLLTINFPREPLLGYGYMRIDYTDKFESINSYAGAMTHNTFLQVLMGLGLTGLFIVFAQLAVTITSIVKTTDLRIKNLAIGLLIPVLVNSFTEFGIFGETNYGIMFYLFIVFNCSVKLNEEPLRIKRTDAKGTHTLFGSAAVA